MIKNKAQETEETFSRYRYINNFAPKLATNQCYYTQYEEVPKQ